MTLKVDCMGNAERARLNRAIKNIGASRSDDCSRMDTPTPTAENIDDMITSMVMTARACTGLILTDHATPQEAYDTISVYMDKYSAQLNELMEAVNEMSDQLKDLSLMRVAATKAVGYLIAHPEHPKHIDDEIIDGGNGKPISFGTNHAALAQHGPSATDHTDPVKIEITPMTPANLSNVKTVSNAIGATRCYDGTLLFPPIVIEDNVDMIAGGVKKVAMICEESDVIPTNIGDAYDTVDRRIGLCKTQIDTLQSGITCLTEQMNDLRLMRRTAAEAIEYLVEHPDRHDYIDPHTKEGRDLIKRVIKNEGPNVALQMHLDSLEEAPALR